jgi:hypothetical protein
LSDIVFLPEVKLVNELVVDEFLLLSGSGTRICANALQSRPERGTRHDPAYAAMSQQSIY